MFLALALSTVLMACGGSAPSVSGPGSGSLSGSAKPSPEGSASAAEPRSTLTVAAGQSGAGTLETPSAQGASGTPSSSPSSEPSPEPSAGTTIPLAVVTGFGDYSITSVSMATLAARLKAGTLLVPCGAEAAIAARLVGAGAGSAGAGGSGAAASGATASGAAVTPTCLQPDTIARRLHTATKTIALLPPGLVTPAVRAVPIGNADLFGDRAARSLPYPLVVPTPPDWPGAWAAYDPATVRVVVTTGVNCPDRGVSHQTNVLGRGWDWLLQGGTARYAGRHWDSSFGWWVVDPVRTGHAGALADLIRNADIATSDFECSMTSHFVQHDHGTVFTIDPKVAPMMAKAGFDVATIAADHNTNAGLGPVVETVKLFERNGIRPVGGGANLAQALRPAVIDVNGVKFGFVGFDAIGGSVSATSTHAGVAPLTLANAQTAIGAARAEGAQVVFAMPQWSSVEYRATFTGFQRGLIALLERAGADHIIGADFHWAGGVSITSTTAGASAQAGAGTAGYRFVSSSEGNFWFGQNWSRQTQEGIITSLAFVGTRLVQVRFTPTVVVDNAQVNLTNPATDGQSVLKQVLSASTLLNP